MKFPTPMNNGTKKIVSLVVVVLVVIHASAQVTVSDFESGSAWTAVEGAATVVNNPSETGLNLSCKVLQVVRPQSANNWAGAMYTPSASLSGYRYVHVLMYRNNTNQPNLKAYDPADNDGSADLAPMTTIVANQWQDVVFDLGGHSVDFLFFMVDRTTLSADAVMYIDDVVLSNDASPRTSPNAICRTTPEPTGDYELVWNADFTESSLNLSAWNIETNGDGGGNSELQYYCDRGVRLGVDPVEGKHCLILTATKENYMGKTCTSGRVNSFDKTYFQYGKIEARIWFPNTANGLWPAFWMMGNDYSTVGWPACGETDIIELGHQNGISAGTQDRFFNGASHWGPIWSSHYQYAQDITNAYSVEDGFHIITCIWDADHVAMYVDLDAHPTTSPYYSMTIPVSSEDNAPGKYFHKPNGIIFNLAVGGQFPGIYDINGITALSSGSRSMYVDWVRVYQKGDAGESFYSAVASDPIEGSTAIDHTISRSTPEPTRKILRNGQILIERDGARYTLLGTPLSE